METNTQFTPIQLLTLFLALVLFMDGWLCIRAARHAAFRVRVGAMGLVLKPMAQDINPLEALIYQDPDFGLQPGNQEFFNHLPANAVATTKDGRYVVRRQVSTRGAFLAYATSRRGTGWQVTDQVVEVRNHERVTFVGRIPVTDHPFSDEPLIDLTVPVSVRPSTEVKGKVTPINRAAGVG